MEICPRTPKLKIVGISKGIILLTSRISVKKLPPIFGRFLPVKFSLANVNSNQIVFLAKHVNKTKFI